MKKDFRIVMEIKDGDADLDYAVEGSTAFLKRFDSYSNICIQCHDNPDADALASGYALHKYFSEQGKKVRFIYGGRNIITKPNLCMMIKELGVPVEHADEDPECDILITTDCQYGAGNVTKFEAPAVAMIDHHQCGLMQNKMDCIKSNLGSCSTVVWSLFNEVGYDITDDINVSTALYYGLYSDTSQFEEIYHPVDKDMRDTLPKNSQLLIHLMNTNLSLSELNIASEALSSQVFNDKYHFSMIPTRQCDPNILGIISDFVVQVEEVDICVAFNPNPGGYKLSVRSCVKEAKANEVAQYLCKGIGNGGGHLTKGGGFIAADSFAKAFPDKDIMQVLTERVIDYHDAYKIIYAKTYDIDMTGMKEYVKKPVLVGVAKAVEFLKEGTPIMVRTLEGDIDIIVEDDLYFMIGIEGEVYPIREEKFTRTYKYMDGEPDMVMEYAPTVRNNIDGEVYQLTKVMHTCVATGTSKILARELKQSVKIFTAWDENKYYKGEVGDFVVVREDDAHDIYIVQREIFFKTYELV